MNHLVSSKPNPPTHASSAWRHRTLIRWLLAAWIFTAGMVPALKAYVVTVPDPGYTYNVDSNWYSLRGIIWQINTNNPGSDATISFAIPGGPHYIRGDYRMTNAQKAVTIQGAPGVTIGGVLHLAGSATLTSLAFSNASVEVLGGLSSVAYSGFNNSSLLFDKESSVGAACTFADSFVLLGTNCTMYHDTTLFTGENTVALGRDNYVTDVYNAAIRMDGTSNRVSQCQVWEIACYGDDNLIAENEVAVNPDVLFLSGGIRALGYRNVIRDNLVYSNLTGIYLEGGGNVVVGNKVGVSISGRSAWPNTVGIAVGGQTNRIGGTAFWERNYIAGNERDGLQVSGSGHVIQGNYIGLGIEGVPVGNGWAGINLINTDNVVIGGVEPAAGNVICLNGNGGIVGWSPQQRGRGVSIRQNWIGVAWTGNEAYAWGNGTGSVADGLRLSHQEDLLIQDNVISGHAYQGVFLQLCTNVVLWGNRIGIDPYLPEAKPNRMVGVHLLNVVQVLVGGTNTAQRNIISGNRTAEGTGVGLQIAGRSCRDVIVQGNHIGVDNYAEKLVPNGSTGVLLYDTVGVTLGGADPGAGNVIGGNSNGVHLLYANTNWVLGNFIGTDTNGSNSLPNFVGICLESAQYNVIGLPRPNEGNVIAGNTTDGVWVKSGYGNRLLGNRIGTTYRGGKHGNGRHGVYVGDGPGAVTVTYIGGATNRDDSWWEGNFIMGNGGNGVHLSGPYSSWSYLNGNTIAYNTNHGLYVSCQQNRVGETNGNLIFANGGDGIHLMGAQAAANNNLFLNNHVGYDPNGLWFSPNQGHGVVLGTNCNGNTFGQSRTNRPNVILAQAPGSAIFVRGAQNSYIKGNFLGARSSAAVRIENTTNSNTFGDIGGPYGNVILGEVGVDILRCQNQMFTANWIGFMPDTNAGAQAQSLIFPQMRVGLRIVDGKNNSAASSSYGNFISNTRETGILLMGTIRPDDCQGNVICGNRVGFGTNVLASGVAVLVTNLGNGIVLSNAARNQIGYNTNSGNYLAGNSAGVLLINSLSNTVAGNRIGLTPAGEPLGNRSDGIRVSYGTGDLIGGNYFNNQGNVIVGSVWDWRETTPQGENDGIEIAYSQAVRVQGNCIGLDPVTQRAIPNERHGIFAADSTNLLFGGSSNFRNYIAGNSGHGIFVGGSLAERSCEIYSCRIGTDTAGINALPNGGSGIFLEISRGNLIGNGDPNYRNIISGNRGSGIHLRGTWSRNNDINGNYIGVSWDALAPLGNQAHGIVLEDAPANTIGKRGLCDNVIAGNGQHGILILGAGAGTNLVHANLVGLVTNGTTVFPNVGDGVRVWQAGAVIITSNLICGNLGHGVTLGSDLPASLARGNVIAGNRIGYGPQDQVLGNTGNGVWLTNAQGNLLSPGNTIGANGRNGIELAGAYASQNQIAGNWIGGNHENGVWLDGGPDNRIGGNNAPDLNHIVGNGAHGVSVTASTNNSVLGNSIRDNHLMGINLGPMGINNQEQDGMPNRYQNFPTLTNVVAGSAHVDGFLQSAPLRSYLVEFFANDQTNAAGFVEGRAFLGRAWIQTDNSGHAGFALVFPFPLTTNQVITATATDTNGNTSEFSAPALVRMQADGDADADGLPDTYEAKYTNLNHCATCDYDGDGLSNYEEYVADTNPEDRASVLRVKLSGDTLDCAVTSTNRLYTIQQTTTLAGSITWTTTARTTGTGSNLTFNLPPRTNALRLFLRAKVELP
jgi:hypothetical protein